MKTKSAAAPAVHLLVTLLALLAGIGLDYAAKGLRDRASQTFDFAPSVMFNLALPILLSLIILGLVWYLYRWLPHPRPAAYFYLTAGLVGMLIYASIFLRVMPFLHTPIMRNIRMWFAELGFGSFHLISGFLLVLGSAGSIRKKP